MHDWQVLGGASPNELRPIGSAEWNGLHTSITLQQQPAFVALPAFDAAGRVIGKSQAVAIGV